MSGKSFKILLLLICFTPFLKVKGQTADSLAIGYSYINSIPQNSQVFLNDSLIGFTPLYFILDKEINPSPLFIVKQKGYLDYSLQTDGENRINQTVILISSKPGKLLKNPVEVNKSQYFAKPRKVLPIVITSALTACTGILSYYFKKLANDNYDSYSFTGDPAALTRKKRYDLISGISLGAFQISFAGLLYYLFFDN